MGHFKQSKLRALEAAGQHNKKTRKRERVAQRKISALKRASRKAKGGGGACFPAIALLHDPQGLAERMFAHMRGAGERFEVRLMQASRGGEDG